MLPITRNPDISSTLPVITESNETTTNDGAFASSDPLQFTLQELNLDPISLTSSN